MDDSEGWNLVSIRSDFLQLQSDWEQIYRSNVRHSPFQAWGWVNAWLSHLAGPHELLVACHRDPVGDLDFVLPLIRRTGGGIGMPDVMLVCSYGPECSEKLGSLRTPNLDDRAATMAAEAVSRFLEPSDYASLAPLDTKCQSPDTIARAIGLTGRKTSMRPGVVCPTLGLPDSWEVYLQQLSSNFRSQVRRSEKNFTGTGESVSRALTPADAETFTRELIRLNRGRMQAKGDVSSMEDEAFRAFLLEAIPYMASQDIAWMDVVENDAGIYGVSLNFVHGKEIYYYSGGFDDRFSKLRPGTALFAFAIRRGIESGYTSFNFLRGDESYKYRWGAKDVVDHCVVVFPTAGIPALLAAAADRLYVVVGKAKQIVDGTRARLK